MPTNLVSGLSCFIYPLDHPTLPAGLPCQEYKHHALKSSATDAIQEIVTIESNQGTSFEIKLDIPPNAYSLLRHSNDDAEDEDEDDDHHHHNRNHRSLEEYDYLIYVLLDGINAQRSKRFRLQTGPTKISGVFSADHASSRPFQFGKLTLVDPDEDSRVCQDEKIIQALGTIQVNVVRCELGKPKPFPPKPKGNPGRSPRGPPPRADPASLQTTNQMIFSERFKKATQSNTVGLGKPVSNGLGGRNQYLSKKTIRPVVKEDKHPFLQFIFKYKPRSILEAEGIIAPPPPPPPSPPRDRRDSSTNSKKSNQPLIKNGTSSNHYDYLSNAELHRNSHEPGDQKPSCHNGPEDEKKPSGTKKQHEYITIDTDSETECSETEAKRKVTEATRNRDPRLAKRNSRTQASGFGEAGGSVTRKQEEDENKASGTTMESKKRDRSVAAANAPPPKRRSSGGAVLGADNKANATAGTLKPRESLTNVTYPEDSSDDDDEFKDKIIGSKGHTKELAPPKKHPKNTSATAHKVFSAPAQNHRHGSLIDELDAKIDCSKYIDLTGIDSD